MSMPVLSLSFPLALLLLLISHSSSRPYCHPHESSALLQLNTTIGWNQSTDCCTWEGVTCDKATGNVVGLFFYAGELEGTAIAPNSSLFSLTHLESLDVSSTSLTFGTASFRALALNLTSLRQLDMSFSDLSTVPPAYLTNLSSSLTSLELISCMLHGELPDDVFHFPKLEVLDLSNNALSGEVPRSAFNLARLTFLSISNNSFEAQLPEFGRLERGKFNGTSLKRLMLDHNKLQGVVPRSIFQNVKLVLFDLSSNNLSGTVELDDLSKLKKLIYLDFSSNNLSLSFNNSINHDMTFDKLWYLSLSSCNIAEFPHFLKSVKQLQFLDLSNNQIQGSVPKWLLEVGKHFVLLNLSHNSLTHIDSISGDVLQFLDLHSNLFSGPLPTPSARFLRFFSVSRNQFSGEIPSYICNLTTLEVLELSYNNLSGEIPDCVGNSSQVLSVIDLRRNKLRGKISATFMTGSWLRNLNLNGNRLEGAIPKSLVNCSNLEVLDLGINLLNDTFPGWLESLPNLQVLVLRANTFHGSIVNPKSEFPFLKLRIMDLSYNEFNGSLPAKLFENFRAMQMGSEKTKMGYMGEDYYHDSVMVTMKGFDFELVKIQTIFSLIDFSSNYFAGEIPGLLGKLESLKGLNLSHNMLTGTIPSSLGNLTNLEGLDLSSNELVGKIPNELAEIPWLASLNLSHNHLWGSIPRGSQFNTFGNESFMGNQDLCGFPLSRSCGGEEATSSPETHEQDDHSGIAINWKIVMMGYASGFVIGVSIGYMVLYGRIPRKKQTANVQARRSPRRS